MFKMKYYYLVVFLFSAVFGMHQRSMYFKELGLSDLKTSATGYVYHGTSAGPVSYIQFSPGVPKQAVPFEQQEPIASLPPLAPLRYQPLPVLLQPKIAPVKENLEILDDDEENQQQQKENYESGTGEQNNSGYHTQKGEKSVAEYNNNHAFDKGQKGSYENEGHKGHYLQNGGNKNGYFDSSNGYASQHSEGKASKGGNFEESGYHKKGQKTTGYHKVYHKDEYKKDHTFYDESDKKGHYSKYDNADSSRQAVAGGHKAGGSSASGFQNNLYGKEGFAENGRNNEASSGHNSASGRETYQAGLAKFGKHGDRGDSRQYGYSLKHL